jgi:hypothetical protein
MEHPAVRDVVVLETVLDEVKHLSLSAYGRLRALVAAPERRYAVLLNEHHPCVAHSGRPSPTGRARANAARPNATQGHVH